MPNCEKHRWNQELHKYYFIFVEVCVFGFICVVVLVSQFLLFLY